MKQVGFKPAVKERGKEQWMSIEQSGESTANNQLVLRSCWYNNCEQDVYISMFQWRHGIMRAVPAVWVSVAVDVSAAITAGSGTSQHGVMHCQHCATTHTTNQSTHQLTTNNYYNFSSGNLRLQSPPFKFWGRSSIENISVQLRPVLISINSKMQLLHFCYTA